jgi:agmatine deiminase
MPETANETPYALGYRMPAEWEPHRATWIAWPHNREDWPGKFGPIRWVYAEIVRVLSRSERVEILVQGAKEEAKVRKILGKAGVNPAAVGYHRIPTDRVWTRDSGPSFVLKDGAIGDERLGLVHWKFNAWAKYDNHLADRKIPRSLARILGARRWVPKAEIPGVADPVRVVLEGGAIDVNGRGTVLTTEECLLSPIQARNPGLEREDIERFLADYLAARHVIWLGRGIVGDDTHGHVDDLARFVDHGTVVIASESDPSDENYELLRENRMRLDSAVDQDGKALRVVELPMPAPVIFDGQRLPASYANFLIANRVVLVPTFNDPADRKALETLGSLFPDREVVGIHAVDLVWGLGTIHCMTQQEPA